MTSSVIDRTIDFVKHTLRNAEGGHDWFHTERVWKNARHIAREEECDMLIVELAALLHDIADSKFHSGDEEIGPQTARNFLSSQDLDEGVINHVIQIIRHVSFKGGHQQDSWTSKELFVVRDADRLDAIGAIGIARTFNYGGFKNRAIYDPSVLPQPGMSKEAYKSSTAPTINHFYEKLLLLHDLMHTAAGRRMAQERHRFMEAYLEQFFAEWNGER